jgi:hypothetical protein
VKRKPPHAADAACEVAESPFEGIGVYAESGLHASLKRHFAGPEDAFEVPVEGKVVDLVRMTSRGEELVEVQTKRLDKIAPKVLALAEGHRVRVVHPIAAETCIRRVEPGSGELLSERKSPKRGDLYSVFDELVRAPSLIGARNVSLEVLLVRTSEVRCRDGSGSWRRRGDKTLSRDLEEVLGTRTFSKKSDWLGLIPKGLPPPWTSASLGEALGIGADRARKILYSYAAAGLLAEAGKEGRRKLYAPARKGMGAKGQEPRPATLGDKAPGNTAIKRKG